MKNLKEFVATIIKNGGEEGKIMNSYVIMYFNQDTELEKYHSMDFELKQPNSKIFKKEEKFEVYIFGVYGRKYDVQFGNGDVAFIPKNNVTIEIIK